MKRSLMALCAAFTLLSVTSCAPAPAPDPEPQEPAETDLVDDSSVAIRRTSGVALRRTLTFEGAEREYFVRFPRDFDRDKTYWLLVSAHGGGSDGSNFWLARETRNVADELGLDAIVVSPTFKTEDPVVERFPVLGDGAFLKSVIQELHADLTVHPKILLNGYSRGGQFTHRFALRNPELVHAAAPFAAGSWTTPDGRFMTDGLGVIEDPSSFLASPENAPASLRANQSDNFDPRVAQVAALPAVQGAEQIPFLVMCGTLDPRLETTQLFVQSLEAAGYTVETDYPETPHGRGDTDEYEAEFKKYSRRTVEFFLKVTGTE